MQMTYRQFPHPVLSGFDNGYLEDEFNSNVKTTIVNGNLNIDIDFNLSSKTLQSYIEQGKASFVVHMESKSVRFRTVKSTFENKCSIQIDSNDVGKEIEMCTFVIATSEIKKFSSLDFISDFQGVDFKIEKGDILAIAECKTILLDKKKDQLNKNESIFTVVKGRDSKSKLQWELSGNKVIITLSERNFEIYRNISNFDGFNMILANLIVVPVLVEIIEQIKRDNSDSEEVYDIVINQLEKIGYNEEKIKNSMSSNMAYELLGDLLDDSLMSLENLIKRGDE